MPNPAQTDGFKRCCWCKQEKPLTSYMRKASSKDGRGSRCSQCRRLRIDHTERLIRAVVALDDDGLNEVMRRVLQESRRRRTNGGCDDGTVIHLPGN